MLTSHFFSIIASNSEYKTTPQHIAQLLIQLPQYILSYFNDFLIIQGDAFDYISSLQYKGLTFPKMSLADSALNMC